MCEAFMCEALMCEAFMCEAFMCEAFMRQRCSGLGSHIMLCCAMLCYV